jgi:hypothetical protein
MANEVFSRLALKPGQFARACGMSRSWLYSLPAEQWPRNVRVGRTRLIVEGPREFLLRIADQNAEADGA